MEVAQFYFKVYRTLLIYSINLIIIKLYAYKV